MKHVETDRLRAGGCEQPEGNETRPKLLQPFQTVAAYRQEWEQIDLRPKRRYKDFITKWEMLNKSKNRGRDAYLR